MTELKNILGFQPLSSILSAKPIYLLKQCALKNISRCFKVPNSSVSYYWMHTVLMSINILRNT